MKKRITSLLLALVLALSLAGTALAADSNDKATIKDIAGSGATATFVQGSDDKIEVTFTSSSLQNGEQYIILMVSGQTDPQNPTVPTISEGTIRYIDQQQATADNGEITFTVYPDSLQTGVILISSASTGQQIAAIVEAKYIIGDIDADGKITNVDVIKLCQHLAGNSEKQLSGNALLAADADGDNRITNVDVIRLCQHLAGKLMMN